MPERSTIFQTVQLGVEATPGVSVAANRKLQGMSIEPSPNPEVDAFRPMGTKFVTATQLGKDWTEAGLSGRPFYSEIVYALASILKTASPASLGGAPVAYSWTFEPTGSAADTPITYTVEHGDGRADKFTYGLINEFGLTINRGEVSLSGSMFGTALQDGITLTAAPTLLDVDPIYPTHWTVYSDTTSGGLGTTKLGRVLEAEWRVSNRWGQLWVVDASQASFVAHVETEPTMTLRLKVLADANGMLWLARARDGATRFVRLEAIGANISGVNNRRLRIDMATKVQEAGDFSDEDGAYAIEFTLAGVHDATWNKNVSVNVINTVASL